MIKKILYEMFLDDTKKRSYGKGFGALFFISAWLVGTAYGVILLIQGSTPVGLIFELASIGFALYSGSKWRGINTAPPDTKEKEQEV